MLNIHKVADTVLGTEDTEISKRTMVPALEDHTNKLERHPFYVCKQSNMTSVMTRRQKGVKVGET